MKKLSMFLSGVVTTLLAGSICITAIAASESWTITVNPINIQVNGETFQPTNAQGNPVPVFAYNGTTYAPVRALAEAYGLEVGYDPETNMATVNDPDVVGTTTQSPEDFTPSYSGSSYAEFPGIPDFGKISGYDIKGVLGPVFENNSYTIAFEYDESAITTCLKQYEVHLTSAGFKNTSSDSEPIYKKQNVLVIPLENAISITYNSNGIFNPKSLLEFPDIIDPKSIFKNIVSSSDYEQEPNEFLDWDHTYCYNFKTKQEAYWASIKYSELLSENGSTFISRTSSNVYSYPPTSNFLSKNMNYIISIDVNPVNDENGSYMTVSIKNAPKNYGITKTYYGTNIPDFGQFSGATPLVVGNTYGYFYDYPSVTTSSPFDYSVILVKNGFTLLATIVDEYPNYKKEKYIFTKGNNAVSFGMEENDGVSAFLITCQ